MRFRKRGRLSERDLVGHFVLCVVCFFVLFQGPGIGVGGNI